MQNRRYRSPRRRPRQKRRSPLQYMIFFLITLVLIIIFGSYVYNRIQASQLREAYSAINPSDRSYQLVRIRQGSTVQDIAQGLKKAGLIRTELDFSRYALTRGGNGLQAGDYYLQRSQSMSQIYARLLEGPNTEVYRKLFIKKRAPYARQLQGQYRVLASINLAQTILESQWGTSTLASKYNNYYGIKAQGNQRSVEMSTREYLNGKWVTEKDRFAVYANWQAGMLAHAQFIRNGTNLNAGQFKDVLASGNYRDAAAALVKDGYATDPDYAQKIVAIIENYKLNQYD
ncbi:glycoside hydrolase family 73 protein [Oenococcus kitaharae]|nr:endolytic transglycosylase MltG [Oenococcus kitaharae]OEY82191.1 glucosaminidase [Oenococcus kitaharae]OEY82614.1 glucosaminidase [Oenococcus kitaharae]OEY84871.1 glucosaminidase [Oenococcus kitaharae]